MAMHMSPSHVQYRNPKQKMNGIALKRKRSENCSCHDTFFFFLCGYGLMISL